MRQQRFSGLWRHADFRKFWVGETVSVFGDQISYVVIPLAAALSLKASATQMGFLTAASRLPWLLFGLVAGVWVDRLRRRPVLILADVLSALLLLSIPIAAWFGILHMSLLIVVAFLVGVFGVFFDLAYYAYVPRLVGRGQIVEANSKLEVSSTLAQVAGPGIAGVLAQILTAPVAVFADALSFLVSAFCLKFISAREPVPTKGARRSFRAEVSDGLRHVFGHPVLRAIVAGGGIHNFSTTMLATVFVLYVTRTLDIAPAIYGAILAVGSVGAVLGALAANRVGSWLGVGPAIVVAQFITMIGGVFYPFAHSATARGIALLAAGQLIWGFSRPILNVNQVSLRQSVTPDHLLGRMTASIRFVMWGLPPLGGLAGGFLGTWLGLRETLVLVVVGELVSAIWFLLSPLSRVRAVSDTLTPSAT
jgi:MFS family permease